MALTRASAAVVKTEEIIGTRNKIINGAMEIDQRNSGSAVTGQQYLVDRWRTWFDPGTYSFQRVSDAPPGFGFSLKVTKTNTTQSNYGGIVQYIEGFNTEDLEYGTATAKTITLSFWVKSSVTGTFTVALGNSAENRWYGATYVINASNTWEYKTVTILGDTTGTWVGATNGIGLQIWFNYGQAATAQAANTWTTSANARATTGSTNLGTTNGATWQITGVQLEVGSVATTFERRPYGQELALCYRYCFAYRGNLEFQTSSSGGFARQPIFGNGPNKALWYPIYPVPMRTTPSLTLSGIDASSVDIYNYTNSQTSTYDNSTVAFAAEGSTVAGQIQFTTTGSPTTIAAGHVGSWRWNGAPNSAFIFSAEL